MRALSIKNPYAFEILEETKKIEYRTWLPGDVTSFLLVSSSRPSGVDFGLGMPNGYALAIISIDGTTTTKDRDGYYHWQVVPKMPIEPFKVKGKLHFYDVDDKLIKPQPQLVQSMAAFLKDDKSAAGKKYFDQFLIPLELIGIEQMPKKYLKILDDTNGDWNTVAKEWVRAGK